MPGVVAAWAMVALTAGLAAPGVAPRAAAGTAPRAAHDVHVCHTRLVQDARQVLLRVRCFRDDLDSALVLATGRRDRAVGRGAAADSALLRYVAERLTVRVNGRVVTPVLTGAGTDPDPSGEPAWWLLLTYDAGAPVNAVAVRQGLLLEVFATQQNLVQAMRARDEARAALFFTRGEDREVAVVFAK